jgi:hypothetical protein
LSTSADDELLIQRYEQDFERVSIEEVLAQKEEDYPLDPLPLDLPTIRSYNPQPSRVLAFFRAFFDGIFGFIGFFVGFVVLLAIPVVYITGFALISWLYFGQAVSHLQWIQLLQ